MGKVFKAMTKVMPKAMETDVTEPTAALRGAEPESIDFTENINEITGRHLNERLIAATEASSGIAENFRRLRNRILHPAEGKPPQSILVTSILPGEGKSFVCANLALTIAQSLENQVLLLDADLRRPSLADHFGISNDRGLVNHLQDAADIARLILPTGFQKLSLIPSGPPPINPAELLDSEKMSALIKALLAGNPDRILIIDSPPISAASETAVLAKYVDGIIPVIRWGCSRREQVKRAIELIGRDLIIGVIFNAFQVTAMETKLLGEGQDYYYSSYYKK